MGPRRAFLVCLLLCLGSARAWAGFWEDAWLDPALMQAQDLNGGTGFIHVPSPQSLPDGLLTGGVHGFMIQAGRGFPYGIEAGGEVQLDGWDRATQSESDEWQLQNADKENLLYARWAPLRQGPHCPVDLAAGIEGVGMQDLGFRLAPLQSLKDQERQYVVAGGSLAALPMLYAAAGYGGGEQVHAPFAALSFAPFPGMSDMVEWNDGVADVGVRVLLSTRIKLDLDVSDLQSMDPRQPFNMVLTDNVSFGVSYSQAWP